MQNLWSPSPKSGTGKVSLGRIRGANNKRPARPPPSIEQLQTQA